MDQTTIFLTILAMALATYPPRAIPALALASRSLNPVVVKWLSYIPAAVLSALLTPSLVLNQGQPDFSTDNIFLWAALPTLATAWFTKSFFGAVAVGMAVVAGARFFFGQFEPAAGLIFSWNFRRILASGGQKL